ncbi:MAG TPA: glycosyl hydrolase family 18 protein [Gemmatimonadaceae bacterium]
MRQPVAWLALAGSAALALASPRPAFAQSSDHVEALWYSTASEKSVQSFLDHASQISIVSPQVFAFDKRGSIHGKLDPRVVEAAHAHGVKLVPLVMNPGFDQPTIHRVLTVASVHRHAVSALVALCRDQHLDGIQFDIENVSAKDRDALTRFMWDAASALRAIHCPLSAAVVPRANDSLGESNYDKWIIANWRGAYDYKALADSLDFLSYMTYAEHTGGTTPGPVAGYTWMEQDLRFVLSLGVPPSKLSIGIPSYSDWWYPNYDKKKGAGARGSDVSYAKAESLLTTAGVQPTWDDKEKAAYAFWPVNGVNQFVWIENARAFTAKLDLVRKYKLRGYSVWVLGTEDPAVWSAVGP